MIKVELTRGLHMILCEDGFKKLDGQKCNANKKGHNLYYARFTQTNKCILVHRFLLDAKEEEIIDHINGNTLDNRLSNLRIAKCGGNQRNRKLSKNNTSGFKGVSFNKSKNKWRASIRVNTKSINLGYFFTPLKAYKAYKEAALKYHGEFANFG